jgi:3-oxoacyl-[acyl-carrier protein] reductase
MEQRHANKVAVVTGAASGIGQAHAVRLASEGAAVVIADVQSAEDTLGQIEAAGGRAIAVHCDVANPDSVAQLGARVQAAFGRCDILVNNAGLIPAQSFEAITFAEWRRIMAVNLDGVFLVTQCFLPGMRERRWGRIVNISSGAARGAGGIGVHYNASKAGMEGLTRGYAARLVKQGITVNAVAPSLIDTDMMNARRDQYAARIPLGRMGTAAEVAQAVLMVVGNEYMTGQTVQLNGGTLFI